MKDSIIEKFKKAEIDITEKQAEKLQKLTEFMLEYNQKVNLTRIVDEDEIIEKHYIDSILPLVLFPVPRGTFACDVGAGAGFPSLPMKIYQDDLQMTMFDSLNKRITYLKKACDLLELDGISAIHGRGEDFGRTQQYREFFGMATVRAVANLKVIAEYCLPLVKVGGVFLAMKGAKSEVDDGSKAHIRKLGGEIKEIKEYSLPSGDKRHLIVIEKIKPTEKVFPRNSNLIQKMQ